MIFNRAGNQADVKFNVQKIGKPKEGDPKPDKLRHSGTQQPGNMELKPVTHSCIDPDRIGLEFNIRVVVQ